ncbi:DNA breaking-rejoining enzyme [Artomyces pyxidatus]|uniref:DNA breaking-rejoining enzyme n=1 Tax=Artomyces pyxidatus TaxID=48021 RepID=A0ACB8SGT0_9AGAM|nr:DNA breaking-rejoining enzyme [Artomyces pyxidatus]
MDEPVAPPTAASAVVLSQVVQDSVSPSIDQSTRVTYGAGLLRFTQYCDSFGIDEFARMPASDILLAGFVAAAAGRVSSAQQWISGLHLWHDINGAPWFGGPSLKRALAGVKKLAPAGSRRPPRPPVTFQHMCALLSGLDLLNTKDAAVWAAASIAFWSVCRLGELLVATTADFQLDKHVTRGASFTVDIARNGTACASLHIPWTKTTGRDGADIVITDLTHETSPYHAVRYHLAVNNTVPLDAPFFAFEQGDGWATLTKSMFLDRCNEVWRITGHQMMTGGHSFRIGGTTEWLLRGAPPDVVQKQGRWMSGAFLLYWRKVQTVLPFFISQAFDASEVARLDKIMDDFERQL